MADRVCRGRAVQKKSARDALAFGDSRPFSTEEAVSLLALAVIEVREQVAALEYQLVRLRLQLADDAIRLPPTGLAE